MVICLERGADLHMARLMPRLLTVSCFSRIQIGLPFWYRLIRVVPEKGPLNGCVCVCVRGITQVETSSDRRERRVLTAVVGQVARRLPGQRLSSVQLNVLVGVCWLPDGCQQSGVK